MIQTDYVLYDYLRRKQSLPYPTRRELWPSDLGMPPDKAMGRIVRGDKPEFDDKTLAKMQLGDHIANATAEAYCAIGVGTVDREMYLFNGVWSGKADFVLNHNGPEDFLGNPVVPVIIEHKGVSDEWFDYRQTWPKSTHVCQLWLYGYLYKEIFGQSPDKQLVYRSHNHLAVFNVSQVGNTMQFSGRVDGQEVYRTGDYNPDLLRQELEFWLKRNEMPTGIPPYTTKQMYSYPEDSLERLVKLYGATENG